MKNYETYNDSLLSPHNPNGDGYTEESEPEEINYDNPNPNIETEYEQYLAQQKQPDLTTMLFKQILTSF